MAGNCIEPVVKFACGATWFAFAAAGVATTTAWLNPATLAVVGGAGLIAAVTAGFRKFGVESAATLGSIRQRTLEIVETKYGSLAEQLALADADRALDEYLPQCFLDREALVAATRDTRGFPTRATEIVMAKLAESTPDVFGEKGPQEGKDFANLVVATALDAAVNTPEYFQKLQPRLELLQMRSLAELVASNGKIEEWLTKLDTKVDSIKDDTTAIRDDTADLKEGQQTTNELLRQLLETGGVARAEAAGLSEMQIVQLLEGYVFNSIAVDQVESLLLKASEELKGLCARLAKLSNEDEPEIAVKLRLAKEAIDAADFAKADRLLAEAEDADMKAGERRIRRAAETMADRGSLANSQAKFKEAAAHYGRAAAVVSPYDAELAWKYHFWEANALYEHGQLFPGLESLHHAITIFRHKCLPHTTRNTYPADWAMTQNNLGNALSRLGERAGGDAAVLNEAVAAYRAALQVYTRETMPADWAMTQNNLGAVLSHLGTRAGGEVGLTDLKEAVAALSAALEVYTRETTPATWAKTQNNLGVTLKILGERTGGDDGLAVLAQAVEATCAALQVSTREAAPADWAEIQNNLGNILTRFGERSGGKEGLAALNEAIGAYRAAIQVFARLGMLAHWANTQNNLGITLRILGCHTGGGVGHSALIAAVAAYRAALEVLTCETMPADWAATQNNLGNALRSLGERTSGNEKLKVLEEAMAAFRAALEVRTRDTMPDDWAFTTECLAIAEASFAMMTNDSTPARHAIARMDAVIAVYQAMQAGFYIEQAKRNLAAMRSVLAKIEHGKSD